ncbi:Holliday junction branch migration protein RuvA [Candidatus Kaiserbacteria bacterium]|nr:Holliday junction branch migration protein RuvA [Candidatus Kaiserbacteria bacterium]
MIRFIRGEVLDIGTFAVTVDVGGIGYLIHTPSTSGGFAVGEPAAFHTHLAVRENALDLYGFLTTEELDMFLLLIGLPKIGPKSAMLIMSQADVALLRKAALSGDASYLSKISGIGKKSAEKIVMGLREKFGAEDIALGDYSDTDHDVMDALITLGYSQKESRDALKKMSPELTETNARIKAALKLLGR